MGYSINGISGDDLDRYLDYVDDFLNADSDGDPVMGLMLDFGISRLDADSVMGIFTGDGEPS